MAKRLWEPDEARRRAAQITAFRHEVNRRFGHAFVDESELWAWSVSQPAQFWDALWSFVGIRASRLYDCVVDNVRTMPGARWFSGARLNFAENLLWRNDETPALIAACESGPDRSITFGELRRQVARLAGSLRRQGIGQGDRVVGFLPNIPEAVIAMLAATSLGALWSSCSPDFGLQGVLDRFAQIEPRVLITADGYSYGGKRFDSLGRVREVLERLPSVETLLVVPFLDPNPALSDLPTARLWEDFLGDEEDLTFQQLPPDHPVYIMYSSGTTGVPKCIVHGAAGTLVQHKKELMLHTDLRPGERIFYYTTCGWMMWNWLVSSLSVGATVVLYDGSPTYPDGASLFRMVEGLGINVFGTSAKFLAAIEKAGVRPRREADLSSLRAVLSTGSPLSDASFRFVYEQIGEDLCLSSISGGTDLISCFALGCPTRPVIEGELQCRGLGMDVAVLNDEGRPVIGEKGELCCLSAFPSMPVAFWNDPDGRRYRQAYFERFEGVWHHGDYAELRPTGGMVIYGRSDATLNPGGVRIGTAELYRAVEGMDEVADSLAVGQPWGDDQRVVLFVKLADGVSLDDDLAARIRRRIREETTPRHVPARVLAVPDIPYTISGKKVELAVQRLLAGQEVANRDALKNPQALDAFAALVPDLLSS